jgi:hypothetical protein
MKYAIDMAPCGMIYIPSFITWGTGKSHRGLSLVNGGGGGALGCTYWLRIGGVWISSHCKIPNMWSVFQERNS